MAGDQQDLEQSTSSVGFGPSSSLDIASLPSFEGIDMEQLLSDIELHVSRETATMSTTTPDDLEQQDNDHGGPEPYTLESMEEEVILGDEGLPSSPDDLDTDTGFDSGFDSTYTSSAATPTTAGSSMDFLPQFAAFSTMRPKLSRGGSLSSSSGCSTPPCSSDLSSPGTPGGSGGCHEPSVSPPLNSDPFLSFTGSSLLDTFGCGAHQSLEPLSNRHLSSHQHHRHRHQEDILGHQHHPQLPLNHTHHDHHLHAADGSQRSGADSPPPAGFGRLFSGHSSVWDSPPSSSNNSFEEALELSESAGAACGLDGDDFPLLSDDSIWDTFINSNLSDIMNGDTFLQDMGSKSASNCDLSETRASGSSSGHLFGSKPPPPLPLTSSLAMLLQQKSLPPAKSRTVNSSKPAATVVGASNQGIHNQQQHQLQQRSVVTHTIASSSSSSASSVGLKKTLTLGTLSQVLNSSNGPLNCGSRKGTTLGNHSTLLTTNSSPGSSGPTTTTTTTTTTNLIVQNGIRHTLRLNGSTIALTPVSKSSLDGTALAGNQLIFTGSGKINGLTTTAGGGLTRTGTLGSNHIIINYSDLGMATGKGGQVTLSTSSGKNLVLTSTLGGSKRPLPLSIQTASLVSGGGGGSGSVLQSPKRLKDASCVTGGGGAGGLIGATSAPGSGKTQATGLPPPSSSVLMNLLVNGEDVSNGYTRLQANKQPGNFSSNSGPLGSGLRGQRNNGPSSNNCSGFYGSSSSSSTALSLKNNSRSLSSNSCASVATDPLYSMSCSDHNSMAIGVNPFG